MIAVICYIICMIWPCNLGIIVFRNYRVLHVKIPNYFHQLWNSINIVQNWCKDYLEHQIWMNSPKFIRQFHGKFNWFLAKNLPAKIGVSDAWSTWIFDQFLDCFFFVINFCFYILFVNSTNILYKIEAIRFVLGVKFVESLSRISRVRVRIFQTPFDRFGSIFQLIQAIDYERGLENHHEKKPSNNSAITAGVLLELGALWPKNSLCLLLPRKVWTRARQMYREYVVNWLEFGEKSLVYCALCQPLLTHFWVIFFPVFFSS